MTWTVEFDNRARKELRKLDANIQKQLLEWLNQNLAGDIDPRAKGTALKGKFRGLWKYRIGDYRIVCQIRDREIVVLIVRITHRKEVYNS